jgi:hypothetical protein
MQNIVNILNKITNQPLVDDTYIKHYQNYKSALNNDLLDRLGLNASYNIGKNMLNDLTNKTNYLTNLKQKFGNIYTKKDIENIAIKWGLKFLPVNFYNGIITSFVKDTILQKESLYNINIDKANSFILAPVNCFTYIKPRKEHNFINTIIPTNLPGIMFYKIDNDYYSILEHWGDDLKINIVKSLVNKSIFFISSVIKNIMTTIPYYSDGSNYSYKKIFNNIITMFLIFLVSLFFTKDLNLFCELIPVSISILIISFMLTAVFKLDVYLLYYLFYKEPYDSFYKNKKNPLLDDYNDAEFCSIQEG